ncbi:MAG: hypothetical protein HY902_10695 [Deltaproteobacteria bacterium]|nr:hypothetical protein [Deltaproteobacteria bacterium]
MNTRLALPILAALAGLTWGCSDSGEPVHKSDASGYGDTTFADTAGKSVLEPSDGVWFAFAPATSRVAIMNGQAELLALADPGSLGLAVRTASPKVQFKFGSFLFDDTGAPPWQSVAKLELQGTAENIAWFHGFSADSNLLGTLRLTVETPTQVRLSFEPAGTANQTTVAWNCEPKEHFVGFGGQGFDVDHRGHRLELWVSEDGIGKLPAEEPPPLWFVNGKRDQSHTPMPLFVSSRNYGALLRSEYRVLADVCKTDPKLLRWENQGGTLDVTLVVAGSPQAVNSKLATLLGTPRMLPGFALMPWIDAIYGSNNVLRIAKKLKELNIPASAIWSEDWRGGTGTAEDYTLDEDWKADDKLYPNMADLSKKLHDFGFKFLTYNNTFVTQDAEIWSEATTKGYAIKDSAGKPYTFIGGKFVPATMLDLDNPDAVLWAKQVYATGLEAGADGWMADFCEWLPTDAVTAAGSGWSRHQGYPVQYQKLNQELLDAWAAKDGRERLTFVRSAWLGSQPLVQVMWGGDQQTDFSAGDGFPSVVPIALGLGVAGFPYFGSDIAGYASAGTVPTDKELFFRWVPLAALTPVFRTHHGKLAQANWQWEHDAETTAHFKRWATLHTQLFPYLWMLAQTPEVAMMRPLAWQFPAFEPGWTRTDQFMLGDRIAVAPVVSKGAVSRTVELPPIQWFPLLPPYAAAGTTVAESPVQGGTALPVDVSLTEIPAYVQAGTLLPMLPAGSEAAWADSLARMSAPEAWKKASVGVELWIWPGPKGAHSSAQYGTGDSESSYQWDGSQWTGVCKSATFNGKPATIAAGAIELQGAGTLVLDDTGTLQIGATQGNSPGNNPEISKRVRVVCRGH